MSSVLREDEFIVNVVKATLSTESSLLTIIDKNYGHLTSVVASISTWIDNEIEIRKRH
jgi:hypothetical protein